MTAPTAQELAKELGYFPCGAAYEPTVRKIAAALADAEARGREEEGLRRLEIKIENELQAARAEGERAGRLAIVEKIRPALEAIATLAKQVSSDGEPTDLMIGVVIGKMGLIDDEILALKSGADGEAKP